MSLLGLALERGLATGRHRGAAARLRARRRLLAPLQRLDDRPRLVVVQVLVEIVVDPDHRRVGAGPQALELAQEEAPVVGRLADPDPERVLAGAHHVVRAAEPARRSRAHPDLRPPRRRDVVHVVEGRDLVDLDPRRAEIVGDVVQDRPGQPAAVLLLRHVQERQDGARLPALRVLGDDGARQLLVLGRESEVLAVVGDEAARDLPVRFGRYVHRSTSPNTMSSEPMIDGMSASVWPRPMKSMAARWTKLGERILQRYGLLVPSLTR